MMQSPHVSVRHIALRDDRQVLDVDARFAVIEDMRVTRLMVGGVDDEAFRNVWEPSRSRPN
jgi:hypothetical protein